MRAISRSVVGVLAVTMSAAATVIFLSHISLWARDTGPAIKVDTKPIARSATAGTSYALVIKKVSPSVVNIYSTVSVTIRPYFGRYYGYGNQPLTRQETSLGSGVIVSPDGYILTANHVVDGADKIKVAMDNNAKKQFTATVVGADPATDVAVLKIDASGLPAITLGDSGGVQVGDVVLAVGNPFGVGQSVTMGIVSALGRRSPDAARTEIQDFIQTDAAINPGNSGGALVDAEGRLIGINTMIESSSSGNEGVGFAVSVNLARTVMEHLVTTGKVTRGYLGIKMQDLDADLALHFNVTNRTGILVDDVLTNTPADKAGIKSGDVILSLNGKHVADSASMKLAIAECSPGSTATLKLVRDGTEKTVSVKLGTLPGDIVQTGNGQSQSTQTNSGALDGVKAADLDKNLRQRLQIPDEIKGAVVTNVLENSSASDAGLQRNDVILEINRHAVAGADDVKNLVKQATGERVLLKIWRREQDNVGVTFLTVDNTKRAK